MDDLLGYESDDELAENDVVNSQQRARQVLIDTTRKDLERNFERADLKKHDVFIVSADVIFSLVTDKALTGNKTNLAFDEVRLMEAILKMEHAQRYGKQASAKNRTILAKDNMILRYW